MEENTGVEKQVQDSSNKANSVDDSNETNIKLQQYQAEKNLEKKKNKFIKIVRIVSDIIFVPFFLLIVLSSIIMFSAKLNNEVPSIFGYSAVRVLSGSMEPDLSKNDIVVIKYVSDSKTLKEGDVIAFYAFKEPVTDGDLSDNTSGVGSNKPSIVIGGAQNAKQRVAAEDASLVYIHKIDKIATPISSSDSNYGKLFFHTTGNVEGSDEMWIMEDYVIGKWDGETNSLTCTVLQFLASIMGSITMVIVPSLILIAMFGVSLVKEVKDYKNEKGNAQKEKEIRDDVLKGIEDRQKQSKEKIEEQKQAERMSALEKFKEKEQEQQFKWQTSKEELSEGNKKFEPIEESKVPPKVQPQKPNLPPKAPTKLPPKAPANISPKKPDNLQSKK